MEVYVSTDVETDGPIPGPYSMLSFGSAAYLADKTLVATYYATLDTLPGASAHPRAIRWWKENSAAWRASRENTRSPGIVMPEYVAWVRRLPGQPVFVAYPAAYDFMFVYWYMIHFAGESPFSHSALDIKTLAMTLLHTGYRQTTKANMPEEWFDSIPHTHNALDDALEQGALFCNLLRENETRRVG